MVRRVIKHMRQHGPAVLTHHFTTASDTWAERVLTGTEFILAQEKKKGNTTRLMAYLVLEYII